MAAMNSSTATEILSQKLNKMIEGDSRDYHSWKSLILEIEEASPDDINTITLSYESFLSKFPLCNWHLEKYAHHKSRLSGVQEGIKVYERGAEVAMFSVGFWASYFSFGMDCFTNPKDVRRLFGRALSYVGKDYFCHVLWDHYMNYELNQQGWSFLAESYIQVLRFPTKKLHFYYDNFKQFVANLEEEMEYEKNHSTEVQVSATKLSWDEICVIIKDLLGSSDESIKIKSLDRYKRIGKEFYREACLLDEKIKCFESNIQRQFFSVTPLDDFQLRNWHLYLDFIEKQDNLDTAVKLYERCLIPCANYPEFWMRYVDFLESKKGCELAISAIDRAAQIFLKNVPEIHLFNARYKEQIGDINGARDALLLCETKNDTIFIEKVVTQATMERRLGNFTAASATYKEALETAKKKKKLRTLPILYSHFARLTFMITGSADAARDVLINGIREVPRCRLLYEELINFVTTHEGARQVNIVDSIIGDAISVGVDESDGLNSKDREAISGLFLEFVDLCGTIHDASKARNRHIKLFPHSLRIGATYNHPQSTYYITNTPSSQEISLNSSIINPSSKNLVEKQSPQTYPNKNAMEIVQVSSTNESLSHQHNIVTQVRENPEEEPSRTIQSLTDSNLTPNVHQSEQSLAMSQMLQYIYQQQQQQQQYYMQQQQQQYMNQQPYNNPLHYVQEHQVQHQLGYQQNAAAAQGYGQYQQGYQQYYQQVSSNQNSQNMNQSQQVPKSSPTDTSGGVSESSKSPNFRVQSPHELI